MSSLSSASGETPGSSSPLGTLVSRMPSEVRTTVILALLILLSLSAFFIARSHPSVSTRSGAERQMAAVFGLPEGSGDENITGDLLVERFYIIDADTGDRYVGDFLKGRVMGIVTTAQGGFPDYSLLLDLKDLNRDREFLAAYVGRVAPAREADGLYLGLRIPQGITDAFLLNFTGYLPERKPPSGVLAGESLASFLSLQSFDKVSQEPRLVTEAGVNYLLSNSAVFPHITGLFGVRQAIFVSQHLIVDTGAPAQSRVYFRLRADYPRPR